MTLGYTFQVAKERLPVPADKRPTVELVVELVAQTTGQKAAMATARSESPFWEKTKEYIVRRGTIQRRS